MIRVGQELHEARLKKNITLEEVAKATKIKATFLSAIEKGEYHKLPSTAYAQGFVRNYAEFLGLPIDKTLALFRREFDEKAIFKVLPEGLTSQEFSFTKVKLKETTFVIFLILIAIVGYITFQYRYAIINPPLDVVEPQEGIIVQDHTITILGKTDPNATVFVNNELVYVEKTGEFKKTINVFPGKQVIQVTSVNRFGRQTQVERHIDIKLN